MDLFAVIDQVIEPLRSRGRVSYQALRVQFSLDDEALEALKELNTRLQQKRGLQLAVAPRHSLEQSLAYYDFMQHRTYGFVFDPSASTELN